MDTKENKNLEKNEKKSGKLFILVVIICLIIFGIFIIALKLQNDNSGIPVDNENGEYDIKEYKIGNLYFEDLNNYIKNYEPKTKVEYTVIESGYLGGMQGIFDGEIVIENDNIYLKYEKDNVMQSKKINIGEEKPKYVMVIYINQVEYVYILTMDGNVYLNTNADNVDAFLNFSKVNNLANVSDMFLNGRTPYFIIDNYIYNKYGEIAHHNIFINEDFPDSTTGVGYVYYMQVGNDGLLHKNIIKQTAIVGTPESVASILSHQKKENELYKNDSGETIIVSVLFGVNDDTFLIDKNGHYYKVENINNQEIKIEKVNSKNVISVNKYSKSSTVQKIEINYSDGTKDTYLHDESKSIW